MKINRYLLTPFFISGFLFTQTGCAADADKQPAPEAKDLQQRWEPVLAGVEITKITASPVAGLWEVEAGTHVFYTNATGDKLIIGDMLTMENNDVVNLTEQLREQTRLQALKALDAKDFITYPAKNPKHSIYVFTDADCGYCRKFHQEREAINASGITINYLAMPRTPPGTPSYNKAIAIWCAKDRQLALTEAKEDKFADAEKTCAEGEKIVANDVTLARNLGAQGTPTIILDNGKLVPGYIPATDLAKYFEELDQAKKG